MLAVNDDVASRWGPRIVDFVRAGGGEGEGARRRSEHRGARGSAEADAVRVPSPPRALCPSSAAVAFVIVAVLVGLVRRARRTSASARSSARLLSHVPLLGVHSHLSATDSAILWQLRAPRVVLGAARRRDARARRRLLPGRLPQPARRPVPARRRRRRGARRDDRDRLRAAAPSSSYDLLPLAAFLGAARRRRARLRARRARRRAAGTRRRSSSPGVTVVRVPDRDPDVRPAAALPVAAGGLQLDPRAARHRGLARGRARRARTSSSARS